MEASLLSNTRSSSKKVAALVALAVVGTFAVCWLFFAQPSQVNMNETDEVKDAYTQWKKTYNKDFGGAVDQYRYTLFTESYNLVKENNRLMGSPYSLAVNEFAALSREEFAATQLGYLGTRYGPAYRRVNLTLLGAEEPIPESVDWSVSTNGDVKYVSDVKNQGHCGSCWAFSTTGAVESRIAIKNKHSVVPLSEQQLVDCSRSYGNQGCNGGLMTFGFNYTEQVGLLSETEYPYQGVDNSCKLRDDVNAIRFKIKSFSSLEANSSEALKAAVAQGPVSVAIEADSDVFRLYNGGVVKDSGCGTNLNHGVLVVGYGTLPEQGDYWKVKNSWGKSWGVDGYILLARTSGAGECGIQMDPSFPIA